MRKIVLIAHNLRSTHNVGSLLRTSEGLGVQKVYLTGYTPYPLEKLDPRLPHIALKLDKQIHKTALGAETMQSWSHKDDVIQLLRTLKTEGYTLCAIEQAQQSISLPTFIAPEKVAIIVGREVEGLEEEILRQVDAVLEIPMFGKKESFNVVQAAAMGLYQCRFG